jgi:hypothetical protein
MPAAGVTAVAAARAQPRNVPPCPVRIHYDGGALTTNAGGFTMTAAERTEAQNHANLSRAQSL